MCPEAFIYLLIATSFISYFLLTFLYAQMGNRNIADGLGSHKKIHLLNIRHAAGIFFFGLIFVLANPDFLSLISSIGMSLPNLALTGILAITCILLSMASVRKKNWNPVATDLASKGDAVGYVGIRLVFLLAYEFFFRGVLFFTVLNQFGLAIAILINTILYVAIHAYDSRAELLGCILFGPVLCLLVYYNQSIWPAFIIHACLSLSFEVSLLRKITLKPRYS